MQQPAIDRDAAIAHLQHAVRLPTVSARVGEHEVDRAFAEFIAWVPSAYPAIARVATIHAEPPYELVMEIAGSDPTLDPALLIAHFDVVDVEHASSSWTHDPWGGETDDGFVWGRGSLDDKGVLIAQLEAVEAILSSGATPERGIVLAFGGDEELSGLMGAARIAARLGDRRFHFVSDEGAVIAKGMISRPSRPIALIGIAEKGHVNVLVEASTGGGHAAMPPPTTSVGIVARAIARIEAKPFRPRLIYTVREFFRALAPHVGFPMRLVYGHPGLFWPLLRRVLDAGNTTRALIRTTQAVTMSSGSAAPNVLPDTARATVNVRILPGESVGSVMEQFRRVLRKLPVTVTVLNESDAHEPAPGSNINAESYASVSTIVETLHDCIAAPYLVTGSTDSKWYARHARAVYRFLAAVLDENEVSRIHGVDERLSVENLEMMATFYLRLIEKECMGG